MTSCSAAKLVVRMMDVEKQSNRLDCGVLLLPMPLIFVVDLTHAR